MKRALTVVLCLIPSSARTVAFAQDAPPPPLLLPPPSDKTQAGGPPPLLPPPEPPAAPPVATPESRPAATSAGAPARPRSIIEVTSLRLMRDKELITQAEYEGAIRQISETAGLRAPEEGTIVVGKWATTLFGFVEADSIWDSTRSFNDLAGNAQVARPSSPSGDNSRFTFGARNSRIGFRIKAPEAFHVRTSALLEMDFLGTQLPVGVAQPYQGSEGAFFTNPTFRIRHMNMKVETPVVDVLIGQYWQLFGWQSAYNPNTVELQGVPGELYARTPQIRISKTIKARPLTLEIAVAAARPVQRDAGLPDGEGGIRLALDTWTGMQTVGSTGTQTSPLSVAASGLVRRVRVDQWSASPKYTNDLTMSAFAVDGFVPLAPGTKDKSGNSLSIQGEFATGYGFADMFTGLTGGSNFPALPATGMTSSSAFAANIDNGIVTYDANGNLHGVQWTTYLVGAQYYLPVLNGKLWISGNYSHLESNNIDLYGPAGKVTKAEDWFDANVFVDPVGALRIGLEYANFNTMYADGLHATNHRLQLSSFFIF
ncbi:MAG: hypothetical protein M3O46_07055 [Myxococcota bacterium]|nr:hypothetical protein [Myxococcota bacterium]